MDRSNIYYWKCDRAAAFHGTSDYEKDQSDITVALERVLSERFGSLFSDLRSGLGQGDHRTFKAKLGGKDVFIRTEDGVERDDYLAVEAAATEKVAVLDVPVPRTLAYDCSRTCVPFAWQIIEFFPYGDLNSLVKRGELDWSAVAPQIGRAIAAWQEVRPDGFGLFSAERAKRGDGLKGLHGSFAEYYRLNLARHLNFLVDNAFIDSAYAARITEAIEARAKLLDLERGVLVHKDLAVWNILGTETEAKCYIDWDDCIAGDPMDDLSLMGVTAEGPETRLIVEAYGRARALPSDAEPRFWLCWLRNMIFKSVIRVGAGYFKKSGDGFFLIGGGKDGSDLESVTRRNLDQALVALEKGLGFDAI